MLKSLQIKNSYSEIFELLKYIDRSDLNKIPMNLLETIKENRNEQYVPNIDINDISNSLSKEAMALYMWLYLTYMTDSQDEKDVINKFLYLNEIENQKRLKLNDDIFRKKADIKKINEIEPSIDIKNFDNIESNKKNNSLMVIKTNILTKIINKIKNFFNRGKK